VVEAPGIEGGRAIPVSTGLDPFRPDPSNNFGESSTAEGAATPVSTILDPFQRNFVTDVTGALDRALQALDAGDVEGARKMLEVLRQVLERSR
jgi:hypothetical protein